MKFAFIVYDGMTLLDFAGVYDPITRLKTMGFIPNMEYSICAMQATVRSIEGVQISVDRVKGRLGGFDYIFIPGGNGVSTLIGDWDFMRWIKRIPTRVTLTSVCGGTLVLGAAGFIKDKRATTHPALMQYLSRFTQFPSEERIVDEGSVITARGVTSAIDLGLYMCERIAGRAVREKIQQQMDYHAYCCE